MVGGSYGFDSTLYNDTSRFGDGATGLVKHQCGIHLMPVQRILFIFFCGVINKKLKLFIYTAMVAVQVVLSLTSYIPQIIKLIKRKASEDLSLASWIVSLLVFSTYQILLITGDGGVLNLINALQILQIVAVIILIRIYRAKQQ